MDSEDLHSSWFVVFRDVAFQLNFMDNEAELKRQGAFGAPKIGEELKQAKAVQEDKYPGEGPCPKQMYIVTNIIIPSITQMIDKK